MSWPWSSPTQSDEELRRKEYDVAEVRHEVHDLVIELKSVLDRVEARIARGAQ